MTIICISTIACSNNNKSIKGKEVKNKITLIFESTPPPFHSEINGKSVATEIEYIDDNFIQRTFFPNHTKRFDTLSINTKRRFLEISHYYKTLDKLSYLFQNGDTVIFRYQNKIPFATVKNRETKPYDINFDLFERESITPNDYPAFVKFSLPMFFTNHSTDFIGACKKVYGLAIEKFPSEMSHEKMLLDSLLKNNLISADISIYFKTRSLYQEKVMQLQNIIGFYSIKPIYQNFRPIDFDIHFEYDKEVGYLNGVNILDQKNDSLLYFGFYYDVINWFNCNYLSRKVGRIRSTNYINNIATAGSNLPDFLSLADTISQNKLLSALAKNILLFENIQNIIENSSIDESRMAFSKFRSEVKDTVLVNYVRNKYLLNEESYDPINDMHLVSTKHEHISFNELIGKHLGNVIYINFWSSSCSPCISQLKFSSELEKLYKTKKLVQIHISIESDKNKWITACEKYNLETESYFVENSYTSKQLENMNIKYIPHYLLFDRNGKLVNEFAPRPGEKKLINIIDTYLTEN